MAHRLIWITFSNEAWSEPPAPGWTEKTAASGYTGSSYYEWTGPDHFNDPEFDVAELDIPDLPNNADIESGDLLVTSGLGGKFPPGYPVAVVASVTRIPRSAALHMS